MKYIFIFLLSGISLILQAQNNTLKLQDLAVPSSPASILVDAAPSVIQTPSTPKSFVLGITESFHQSNGSFPQEYSAEFAPYWWIRPDSKSIFDLAGIKASQNPMALPKENPFSGLKFTTASIGLFSKDMIPDSLDEMQKIISLGLRTTLFKIHRKAYAGEIQQKVSEWHSAAQQEMDNNMELFTEISKHPDKAQQLKNNFIPSGTGEILSSINALLSQKPLFTMDLAGAIAAYGVGDTTWKTGKYGIWTTMSSYLPLKPENSKLQLNYLSLNLSVRYLSDFYHHTNGGPLGQADAMDIGGKIALEADKFTFGFESVCRMLGNSDDLQYRTVGLFNVKVKDNLYINGAFGKNFDLPNKLIALFGINWGFGKESVKL